MVTMRPFTAGYPVPHADGRAGSSPSACRPKVADLQAASDGWSWALLTADIGSPKLLAASVTCFVPSSRVKAGTPMRPALRPNATSWLLDRRHLS